MWEAVNMEVTWRAEKTCEKASFNSAAKHTINRIFICSQSIIENIFSAVF
jgi:hypothetical protein